MSVLGHLYAPYICTCPIYLSDLPDFSMSAMPPSVPHMSWGLGVICTSCQIFPCLSVHPFAPQFITVIQVAHNHCGLLQSPVWLALVPVCSGYSFSCSTGLEAFRCILRLHAFCFQVPCWMSYSPMGAQPLVFTPLKPFGAYPWQAYL